MGEPYWRYSAAAAAAPPSSSDRGSIPKPSFPGYLSSEVSTLTNYNPYSSRDLRAASSDFLQKDILPSRAGAYGVDDFAGIRSEPGVSGLTAGTSFKGYPSSFEDPSLLVRQRDVAPGTSPGIPDVTYERPNSMRRANGPLVPPGESNILFVDGLPTDCTRREIGHLFRPFIGFREIRVVHKEARRRGDKAMVLCFVEFTDAKCALTAMEALQGYKFDDKKQNSPLLRIHFAHFPFRLPSDQDEQRFGGSR
ncbi:RNA-binding protein 1 [Sesamum alatum]|uniref:RNA-binding protein 1 n=1 Tax=Sesamum alatum TaxID=300844 RepID=A0AAE1Y2V0_9LAMI|nr:RNA-binding protein 1 [Sesamum alatum]